jgi:hypothetical protein
LTSEIRYFGTLQANLLTGDDPSPQVDRIKMRMAGYQLEGDLAPLRRRCPPDGGSVFQPAFTYGGGLKLRITRLLEFQAEYRENYAKDPDFFNKQSLNLSS